MTEIHGGLQFRPEDVDRSDYFPKGPDQRWGWLGGLMLPKRRAVMLTVEMKTGERRHFEGNLADLYADTLARAGVPVFRHAV